MVKGAVTSNPTVSCTNDTEKNDQILDIKPQMQTY